MSVDVDAVNERLNGLVTLLKAVGVDENARGSKTGDPALDMARQLNDDQIEAIIKKLQQAQTEAPQIIAQLEAHAEARSLAGGGRGGHDDEEEVLEEEEVEEEEVEEEVVEEHEEEEDDDDFDEDANYPMVGHGVSDDISVVSDLTTPTVVNSLQVPEEEHYRETLPPMIVGGVGEPSMIISAPKRKNLVAQVRPPPVGTLPPPGSRRHVTPGYAHHQHHVTSGTGGGAAAARKKMYLDTMAKLHENPNGMGYVGPAAAPSTSQSVNKLKVTMPPPPAASTKVKSDSSAQKVSKSKSSKTSSSKSKTSKTDPEWNSFEEPASKPKSSRSDKSGAPGPTVIDDDGFLVGDTSFDPFTTGSNPFKSSAGDLEFGSGKMMSYEYAAPDGFDAFGMAPHGTNASVGGEKSKSRKSSKSSSRKTSSSGERDHNDANRKSSRSGTSSGRGSGRKVSRRASAV